MYEAKITQPELGLSDNQYEAIKALFEGHLLIAAELEKNAVDYTRVNATDLATKLFEPSLGRYDSGGVASIGSDAGGCEVRLWGYNDGFLQLYKRLTKVQYVMMQNKLRATSHCGLHFHYILNIPTKKQKQHIPAIVSVNYGALLAYYFQELMYLSSAQHESSRLHRSTSGLGYGSINATNAGLLLDPKKAMPLGRGEYCCNAFRLFSYCGTFDVEVRITDASDIPGAQAALATLYKVLLKRALEISRLGRLTSKEALGVLKTQVEEINCVRNINPSSKPIIELKTNSLAMLEHLKLDLMRESPAAYAVLVWLAEKPLSLRFKDAGLSNDSDFTHYTAVCKRLNKEVSSIIGKHSSLVKKKSLKLRELI